MVKMERRSELEDILVMKSEEFGDRSEVEGYRRKGVSNISWASVLNNWIEIVGGLIKLGKWMLVKVRKEWIFNILKWSYIWNFQEEMSSGHFGYMGLEFRVKQGWRFLLPEITLETINMEKKHRMT